MKYLTLWIIALIFIKTNVSYMLPRLVWSPWNPLFACPNPMINIQSKDTLHFICGYSDKKTNENLYLLKDVNSFHTCNATDAKLLYLSCNGRNKDYVDIVFNKYTPDNSIPAYIPGKDYYFIGTADKDNLDNKVNGSCNFPKEIGQNKLRLKIHVCSKEEVASGNCKICKTSGCYYQDCNCSSWINTHTILTNVRSSNCSVIQQRTCELFGDRKVEERRLNIDCPAGSNCSSWSNISDIIKGSSECSILQEQTCLFSDVPKKTRRLLKFTCTPSPPNSGKATASEEDTVIYYQVSIGILLVILIILMCILYYTYFQTKGGINVKQSSYQNGKNNVGYRGSAVTFPVVILDSDMTDSQILTDRKHAPILNDTSS